MRYTHEQLALAYELRQEYGWGWTKIGAFLGVAGNRMMWAIARAEILGLKRWGEGD